MDERDPIEQLMMTDEERERERDSRDACEHNAQIRERAERGADLGIPPGARTVKSLRDRGRVVE